MRRDDGAFRFVVNERGRVRTGEPRQLRREDPDAARRAGHQDPPSEERAPLLERPQRG
jgi:hypothetical protein